jgi:hypothetical protein
MTLKHLPEMIMMVALAIPLNLTPAVNSQSLQTSPENCPTENRQKLTLSSSITLESGGSDGGQGGQPIPSVGAKPCLERASLSVKAEAITPRFASIKQNKDACLISGRIYGLERHNSREIYVVVIDPNTDNALARFPVYSNSPNQPNYEFSLVRPGRYLLSVFQDRSGTLVPFRSRPSERLINCSRGSNLQEIDFELQ